MVQVVALHKNKTPNLIATPEYGSSWAEAVSPCLFWCGLIAVHNAAPKLGWPSDKDSVEMSIK